MGSHKKRIRDPIHDLIVFDMGDPLDKVLWELIQTAPFQRLRRIKQLGFSDYVFPTATHTRLSHSLGAMFIAKKLAKVIERHLEDNEGMKVGSRKYKKFEKESAEAIIAALLHDIGHGPFSHAFESVCKDEILKGKGAPQKHEEITKKLICDGEIKTILKKAKYDPESIAKLTGNPETIYGSIVSSQFDADRLDYMQRDRYMTGTQHAAIDMTWLLDNMEVGSVKVHDGPGAPSVDIFVMNPKSREAVETYLQSLWHLYLTIYFHKATRCAEKLFEMLLSTIALVADSSNCFEETGLPNDHPLLQFCKSPGSLQNYTKLDDSLIIGALPSLMNAQNTIIADFASRLFNRDFYKAIDARENFRLASLKIFERINSKNPIGEIYNEEKRRVLIDKAEDILKKRLEDAGFRKGSVLIDNGVREIYKRVGSDGNSILNQIRIRPYVQTSASEDLRDYSSTTNINKGFRFFRIYTSKDDMETAGRIEDLVQTIADDMTSWEEAQ